MRTTFIVFALVVCAILMANCVFANNVTVSNISLTGQNTTNHSTMVKFDIAWDNSWRDIINYDAAWVFVKYSTNSGATWLHATLSTTGNVGPSTCTMTAGSDGKGVFIYRSANGSGSVSYAGVQLMWNYGTDGVADNVPVRTKVFAIEMVYVPTSEFAVGDGSTQLNAFPLTTINAADARVAPSGAGSHGGQAGGYPTNAVAPLSSSWPNGYNAFYCMKYEITQDEYTDFLNTLTVTQASNRYYTPPVSTGKHRHYIVGSFSQFTTSKPYVACGFLTWADGCAYADWAALRPMTELEFEKACRGDQMPVSGEFAWGTTAYKGITVIISDGLSNEYATPSGANIGIWAATSGDYGYYGPVRAGCFATGSTTREQAGATYYGIMEMSGNLWEQCVMLVRASADFTGTLGDGSLSANGDATNSDWPKPPIFIPRGGGCMSSSEEAHVSTRDGLSATRSFEFGFRCVRQAQ